MRRYIARRLLQAPLTLLLVGAIVFVVLRLTGDPVVVYLGTEATPERVAEVRRQLGLDQNMAIQYLRFMRGVVQGDLGESLRYDRPALSVIIQHLGPSAKLGVDALLLSMVVGLVLGATAAVRRGTLIDHAIGGISVLGLSVPSFWLGIMLIAIFAVQLRWLPTSGMEGPWHYILPSITLAAFLAPQFTLMVRTSLLGVIHERFTATARAKGLSERRILWRHIFGNAVPPIIAFLGLQLATLFGGAVITETVFAWPGVGRLAIDAVSRSDFPIVQGVVLISAIGIILINLLADITIAFADPRIRYE